jgi:3-oxoacyl-[acyl-carrier-protein] synthase III
MWRVALANEHGLAELRFRSAAIRAVATTVGDQLVRFADEASSMGLTEGEVVRLQRSIGLDQRYIVSGEDTTADLCAHSAERVMAGCGVSPADLDGLIFVSQTPDYAAPATAISLQHRLGLPINSMAFDIRLGCSGFVYGLAVAYGLIEGGLNRILLCVGDVASKMVNPSDHAIAPIMGDAGSAILIERSASSSLFQLYSDGSGARALIIPNSGLRRTSVDEGLSATMQMDGASVFNFTLQRVPGMINQLLETTGKQPEDIDYFVLHQPNKYILKNIQKRLKIEDAKMPSATQSRFGNQNSASIPGTISGFLSDDFSSRSLTSVFAGFGIGLSWGAALIETKEIFAPPTFVGIGN